MRFDPITGYQRAVVKTSQRTGKVPRRVDLPARYTFHVTVGIRIYDYPYPPQFTVAWGGGNSFNPGTVLDLATKFTDISGPTKVQLDEGDILRLQHCDILKTGYALEGSPNGETNHAGHNIQCEFTCPPARAWDDFEDWEYDLIARTAAEQIQALRDALGDQMAINPFKIRDWQGSAAYGYGDPWEMTFGEWYAWDGLNGHVDAPDQSHWDPGNWNHPKLQSLIIDYLEAPTMNVVRIGGTNRYDTARLVAAFNWQPGDVAVAASTPGQPESPDALAVGPKASDVLLTKKDEVPSQTVAALRALNPPRVVIVGGEAVISAAVAQAIARL